MIQANWNEIVGRDKYQEWLNNDSFLVEMFSATKGTLVERMEINQEEPGILYWFENDPTCYTRDDIREDLLYGVIKERGDKIWL